MVEMSLSAASVILSALEAPISIRLAVPLASAYLAPTVPSVAVAWLSDRTTPCSDSLVAALVVVTGFSADLSLCQGGPFLLALDSTRSDLSVACLAPAVDRGMVCAGVVGV